MTELSPQTHPLAVKGWIDAALAKGMSPDDLGKMFDLYERVIKQRAEQDYNEGMAACQTEFTEVVKSKDGQRNKYAPDEDLMRMSKPIYTKHGFSISWDEGPPPREGWFNLRMTIRHRGGHCEVLNGNYPHDGTGPKGGGVMNPVQGVVSGTSYAKRNMLKLGFAIIVAGEDHDGNAPTEFCNPAQIDRLNRDLDDLGAMGAESYANGFLAFAKTHCRVADATPFSFAEMPASEFVWAMGEIDSKRKSLTVCTPLEVRTLKGLIESSGTDLARFLAWAGCGELGKFPKVKYEEATKWLLKKKEEGAK